MSTKMFVQIPCGRDSVLFWQRCDMLCTSGFMDDVTFGRSGPYGNRSWAIAIRQYYILGRTFNLVPLAALWYQGGVWCQWMPCYSLYLVHNKKINSVIIHTVLILNILINILILMLHKITADNKQKFSHPFAFTTFCGYISTTVWVLLF